MMCLDLKQLSLQNSDNFSDLCNFQLAANALIASPVIVLSKSSILITIIIVIEQ